MANDTEVAAGRLVKDDSLAEMFLCRGCTNDLDCRVQTQRQKADGVEVPLNLFLGAYMLSTSQIHNFPPLSGEGVVGNPGFKGRSEKIVGIP